MTNIRLLPVVILAIAALLVLKTVGLLSNGGYVLTGMSVAQAAGDNAASGAGTSEADLTVTPTGEPTIADTSPTLSDAAPTLGGAPEDAGEDHSAPAGGGDAAAVGGETAPGGDQGAASVTLGTYCRESDATLTAGGEVILEGVAAEGSEDPSEAGPAAGGDAATGAEDAGVVVAADSFAAQMAVDCLPSGDVVPTEINAAGEVVPLLSPDGVSDTEQQLLARLTARRAELQQYEQDLALRASIVDAAEKRIEERSATLASLEAQISTLVDQRTEMEAGQFAGIVSMYEAMRPKDAATIFNNLEMDVLLRVAKTMNPRKMAPILAEMDAPRAQELTVQMAALADQPATEMTQDDLAALPQIVGQ